MTAYVRNRRARYNYQIIETYEAGLSLQGWEVKAIVAGEAQLVDTHISIHRGEAWLANCHINPGSNVDPSRAPDPRRRRKLLLNKDEIRKLDGKVKQTGMTIIALAMFRKHGKIKVEIALAKGKKQHDKRQALRDREWQRNQGS